RFLFFVIVELPCFFNTCLIKNNKLLFLFPKISSLTHFPSKPYKTSKYIHMRMIKFNQNVLQYGNYSSFDYELLRGLPQGLCRMALSVGVASDYIQTLCPYTILLPLLSSKRMSI